MKHAKLFWLPVLILMSFAMPSCSDDEEEFLPLITINGDASEKEKAVLDEMNYARTKPKEYINARLEPLRSSYTGTALSALNELISEMNSMSALPAYSWGNGLYKSAAEWVMVSGPAGILGHDENIGKRIAKYCSYSSLAENCSYGYDNNDAVQVVIQLLVDDGVEGRGHRKNILSSDFTHAGAAIGTHKTYKYMCCIDFAGGYKEK